MDDLTLYLSRGACSMAAHIALLEAGADFETRHVDLAQGEHLQPAFLKINPHHQVPALKIGNRVLTENVAVLSWIAKTWPKADLLPMANLEEEAQSVSYLAWLSSAVHTAFGPLFHAGNVVDGEDAQESVKAHAAEKIRAHFAEIDETLAHQDYLLGPFSVADAYAFAFYRWAEKLFKLDLSAFPNFTAHQARLLQRPSVKRMLDTEKELAKAA